MLGLLTFIPEDLCRGVTGITTGNIGASAELIGGEWRLGVPPSEMYWA